MKRTIQNFMLLFAGLTVAASAFAQASGTWTLMSSTTMQLISFGAGVLPGGKILYANGDGSGKAQTFDPVANSWGPFVSMTVKRNGPIVATALPNGKVLVAGGWLFKGTGRNISGYGDTSAELYDPSTNRFSATGAMTTGRAGGTITLLTNGKVLVTGGWFVSYGRIRYANCTNATDIYDPASGTWTAGPAMLMALCGHSATLLQDGRVLVAGGANYYQRLNATAEIYDPASNTWTATGSMTQNRSGHSAALMANGKVLVADATTTTSADIFDPATGVFTATTNPNMTASLLFLLPAGKVLLQGYVFPSTYGTAELYNPFSATWTATGSNVIPRWGDSGVQLSNGKVVIVGGNGYDLQTGQYASMTPEIYTP